MMTLYVFRERLRNIYQKYELYFEPMIKFIIGFVVFSLIGKSIGFDARLMRLPVVLILALLTAFTPSAVLVFLAAIVSSLHVYSVSKILSIIIVLILLVLYLLMVRVTPKLGYVVVAVPILFLLKIPYVVPLVLGLIATPLAILPTSCGVIVYFLFKVMKEAASMQVGMSVEDTLQLYTYVCKSLVTNKQMYVTIVIFAIVIGVTYFVRRRKIDYANEIAIASASILSILCFLISDLKFDISEAFVTMIFGTVVSAMITYIILFFKQALDYTGIEYVQFEDDDYYYYVKAVPKITVTTPQKNVKRIDVQSISNGHTDEIDAMHVSEEEVEENREIREDDNYS